MTHASQDIVTRITLIASLLSCGSGLTSHAQSQTVAAVTSGDHNIIVDGVRLWFHVAGRTDGGVSPVVFLHGGPGYNSASFRIMAGPSLENALRMVYLDQRGSGRSERPWDQRYSIALLVDDLEGVRKALGVPRISLLGHSSGGILALEYAAKYPSNVDRMVLVSPSADVAAGCRARVAWLSQHYPAESALVRADTVGRNPRSDCDLAFQTLRDPKQFASYNRGVMFPDTTIGMRLDSIDTASGLRNTGEQQRALFAQGFLSYKFSGHQGVRMPVLVIAGARDHAIGMEQQERLVRELPRAELKVYDRAGHFLYLDEPARFARDVIAFLAASRSR